MNKSSNSFDRKPGFTITEVLVTVGIIGILAAISYQYYMYHYDITGKLASLQKLGTQAIHQMQICVEQAVLHTGKEDTFEENKAKKWDGCESKALLNLHSCEACAQPQLNTPKLALCIEITQGRFTQCVAYRIGTGMRPYKATVNNDQGTLKVCGRRPSTSTPWTGAAPRAIWPYKPCDSHSECCDAGTDSACAAAGRECRTFTGKCDLAAGNGGCG